MILPVLIFLARLTDVSLGTVRIISLSHGLKYVAPLIGFVEINIWLLAIGQIMQNLNNIACSLAYAAGFATGNFVGIMLEEKISIGMVLIRITCKHDATGLIDSLRAEQYGVTTYDGEGNSGPVKIITAIIRRKDLPKILAHIHSIHPHAFYSVEDVKSVADAQFPLRKRQLFMAGRKGK